MRRGFKNGLLKSDSGTVIAINLGADFTAEHEWGIDDLKKCFGISGEGLGIKKRTITQMPKTKNWVKNTQMDCALLQDTKDETILIVDRNIEYYDKELPRDLKRYDSKSDEMVTAWDGGSFGINAKRPEDRAAVRAVYEAMKKNDLAVWIGGGGVFENGGLVLAIVSLIPFDKIQLMHDADLDYLNLQKAAEGTGIAARLKAAGKSWYALSPKWAKGFRDIKTKYEVVYWLNPCEQDIHNYGWFTVEDLELWAKNKGPCMGGRNAKRG